MNTENFFKAGVYFCTYLSGENCYNYYENSVRPTALIEILFSDKAKAHATREFIDINDRVSTFPTQSESKRSLVKKSQVAINLARLCYMVKRVSAYGGCLGSWRR